MNIRSSVGVAAVLLSATACASHTSDTTAAYASDTAAAYASPVYVAAAPVPIDTSIPGALSVEGAPAVNSDNHPLFTRTGLNSDPRNPNGTARPTSGSQYD